MIHIINYGLGNLGSIQNMLKKTGHSSKIVSNPDELGSATKIILPGVGSFDTGIRNLSDGNWLNILNEKVLVERIPVLGICLGLQLMCKTSEEGRLEGLGWFDAHVKKFEFTDMQYKVPHIGWNNAYQKKTSKLFNDHVEKRRYYFVHSFYVEASLEEDTLTETDYGFRYASALEKENMIGVQFHPEKSHIFGLSMLKNFAENY